MVIQAFTLGEHPSNANYERSKVISEGAKSAKVEATLLPPTTLLRRSWYKMNRIDGFCTIEAWFEVE